MGGSSGSKFSGGDSWAELAHLEFMLNESRKLLISSYIDGETTPEESIRVRQLLETSKAARDYFQGQLLVARRVRQALRLDPQTIPFDTSEIMREIFSRPSRSHVLSTHSYRNRPFWVAMVLAGVLALFSGIGVLFTADQNIDVGAKKGGIALEKNSDALWLSGGESPGEFQPNFAKLPEQIPSADLSPVASPRTADLPYNSVGGAHKDGSKDGASGAEPDHGFIPTEILAFPVGASQALKRVDLILPTVLKAKVLEPDVLLEKELNGIVRLDLPTYQENEAIKRLMATLKSEGCGTFVDPMVEERIRRNLPAGPIVIVVQGLDSPRICRVIQGTSKIGLSKNPANQPNSVFDEVIVGNLSPAEAENIPGILPPNSLRSGSYRKAGEPEIQGKLTKSNSPGGAFATISSVSAIRIPGAVTSRRVAGKTAFDSAKAPVVFNIVPLR